MRNSLYSMTDAQLILSGNALEVYHFEKPVFYDFDAKIKTGGGSSTATLNENRMRSMQRAKRNVIRTVAANYEEWKSPRGQKYLSKMWTLTFAENISDPAVTNALFTLFIKRLNYVLFGTKKAVMKYLAVVEFQKRGAVHYHLIVFNLPYIENLYQKISTAWGHGYIWTKKITSAAGAALYVAKYFKKTDDLRLRGIKSYFTSQGLLKPLRLRDADRVARIFIDMPRELITDVNRYDSEYTGKTEVYYYDLSSRPDVRKYILAQLEPPVVASDQ